MQKARVLERPDVTMALAREIASWYERVDVVLAPAVGAISLGFAVALEPRRAVALRRARGRPDGAAARLRRSSAGERTLIVEDVVTTGGSAGEVWALAGDLGAERLGVAALIDRTTSPRRSRSARSCASTRGRGTPTTARSAATASPIDAPGSRHLRTP